VFHRDLPRVDRINLRIYFTIIVRICPSARDRIVPRLFRVQYYPTSPGSFVTETGLEISRLLLYPHVAPPGFHVHGITYSMSLRDDFGNPASRHARVNQTIVL